MYEDGCEHLIEGNAPEPKSKGCEQCRALGQVPEELCICHACGHVSCCDSTPGQYATEHFHVTGHATMQSFEAGADWGWCYEHKKKLGPFPPAK